jgi:DNA repair exonuclease SbcCD ATPase subunit
MKINRLKFLNWRNIAVLDITLDRLTCLRGANARGKSSIRMGIEFALTGRTDATDAKGAGAAGLIRQGADKATLLMKVGAGREVDMRCTLTPASGRTLTVTDPSDAAWSGADVKKWLDAQRDVLSCLLNSRYFIGLKPAEQKTLLSSIILPETFAWPAEVEDKARRAHISINWNQAPFDVIEAGYKAAFEKRRDINRDLKNLLIPEVIPMPDGIANLDDARRELNEMRLKAGENERGRRGLLKARMEHQARIQGVERRVETLKSKLAIENETLAQNEKRVLSASAIKDLKKTVAQEKKLADPQRDLASAKELLAGIDAIIAIYEKLDGSPECPVCRRAVTDDFLVEQLKPQHEAKVKAQKHINDLLAEMKALGDVEGAKHQLEQSEQAAASVKRSQSILSETNSLLNQAESELEGLRSTCPPEVPDEDEESKELRRQITEREDSLDSVAVAEARAQEIERAEKQREQLSKAQTALESLVEYFGPKGVKAALLAEHIGGFTGSINASLAAWGYAAEFEIEPYGFRVRNLQTGAVLPIELLSSSERLRFAVALQVALAITSEIRLVVVDEADMLDGAGRAAFYPLLLAADLDQAIAIGTSEMTEISEVEGAVFYMMGDGNAVQLQPEEVAA